MIRFLKRILKKTLPLLYKLYKSYKFNKTIIYNKINKHCYGISKNNNKESKISLRSLKKVFLNYKIHELIVSKDIDSLGPHSFYNFRKLKKINGELLFFVNKKIYSMSNVDCDRKMLNLKHAPFIKIINNFDSTITIELKEMNLICDSIKYEFSLTGVNRISGVIDNLNNSKNVIKMHYCGCYDNSYIYLYKNKKCKKISVDIKVTDSEYNVAILHASNPLLILGTIAKEISNEGRINTYLLSERDFNVHGTNGFYNINNFSDFALIKEETFADKRKRFYCYLDNLIKTSKNSKFNIYIVDFHFYLYYELMKLKFNKKKLKINLLSDGSFSYKIAIDFCNLVKQHASFNLTIEDLGNRSNLLLKHFIKANLQFEHFPVNISNFAYKGITCCDLLFMGIFLFYLLQNNKNINYYLDKTSFDVYDSFFKVQSTKNFLNKLRVIDVINNINKSTENEKKQFYSLFNAACVSFKKNDFFILGTFKVETEKTDELIILLKKIIAFFGVNKKYIYKPHPLTDKKLIKKIIYNFRDFRGFCVMSTYVPAELMLMNNHDIKIISWASSTLLNLQSAGFYCFGFIQSDFDNPKTNEMWIKNCKYFISKKQHNEYFIEKN